MIANGSISISRSVTQSPKNPKLHLLIDAMPWNNRDLLPLIKTFKIQYIPKFQYRKDKMLLIKKALHPLIKGFWTREQKKLLFSHYGESFFLTVYLNARPDGKITVIPSYAEHKSCFHLIYCSTPNYLF